jgi:hypothetical protein
MPLAISIGAPRLPDGMVSVTVRRTWAVSLLPLRWGYGRALRACSCMGDDAELQPCHRRARFGARSRRSAPGTAGSIVPKAVSLPGVVMT